MAPINNSKSALTLSGLSAKELRAIKKDFGLTETELIHLLTLDRKYRKNTSTLLRKLISN